ncbi:hypoxanthine phosphoribosyltransferase [Megamonas hypermegale]
MKTMQDDIQSVLYTEQQLKECVQKIADEINRDYQGKEIYAIGILKGAMVFYADLVRAINVPVAFDFMAASSYGKSASSSGEVKILKDLDFSIEGKDVIVIEDIVDSGLTLSYLLRVLQSRHPASVKLCALLNKPERREVDVKVDYVGFDVPNEFLVGYGLDYASKYRNLPYIGILKPEVYTKK